MNIRIKKSYIGFISKRELKKLGFKIEYSWRDSVYVLKAPSNIELQKCGFGYYINTIDGKNLGFITGDPFQRDGGAMFLTN